MRCIIIDDEPLAIDLIKEYCGKLDFIDVVGVFTNALDAIVTIKERNVDLIFSDIEMPQINGIDFINSLDNKPLFIFTTAYSQYAVEGFELNAVDYLVKPIPYHRFIKAVSRAKEIIANKNSTMTTNVFSSTGDQKLENDYIFIKADYENVKVDLEDIKYIQGLKDYLKVHINGTNKPILTLMSFKELLSKLPEKDFVRIHRSFVINVPFVKTIQKNKVVIDDIRIPIGDSYKEEFYNRLGIK
ncbi:response regulator transcription factor [Joostella atrarenae]|uniref:Response regulator transcription factor n=1 Tax=Joostella atrarenae TaxID=679257 RepID=A0ABS9J4D7_9FLAO|nr:LytTR family DNA-binding domain-containing protein [Joostella atrarenae]MCF8715291.1 response regulator transcription factor [Joostella atrarenae]